jgi:hypothetical protein
MITVRYPQSPPLENMACQAVRSGWGRCKPNGTGPASGENDGNPAHLSPHAIKTPSPMASKPAGTPNGRRTREA